MDITRNVLVIVIALQCLHVESGKWVRIRGLKNLYLFGQKAMNWSTAAKYCKHKGGHLVTLETSKEDRTLLYYIISKWGKGHNFWTSGNNFYQNKWKWNRHHEHYSMSQHQNWCPGEPNDLKGRENCLEMRIGKGCWNDLNCEDKKDTGGDVRALCEYSHKKKLLLVH